MMFLAALLTSTATLMANFPDADAIVVDDRICVCYEVDGTSVESEDEWVLARTEKGRRSLSSFSLDFSERYGDAALEAVEITGTNGITRAIDFAPLAKVATDNSSAGANIYDPLDKTLTCAIPGLQVGETRHIRWRRRNLHPRMEGAWCDVQLLEGSMPIVAATYTIDAPEAKLPTFAAVRHPQGETIVRLPDRAGATPGRRILSWQIRDVPQAFPEPDMPPVLECRQTIQVSTLPDWPTVSRWYAQLCAPHLAATTPAMTNAVKTCLAGASTPEAKIRCLFRFVSQDVRYMGLTLEDKSPGYAPHDVSLTFEKRYGVCRDKAALLVALLQIAGFEAAPVLIHAGVRMDDEIPRPYFNHAITGVRLPGQQEWLLMDPTDEAARELLPPYLADKSYLVATHAGEPLRTTPLRPAAENNTTITTSLALAADGSGVFSGTIAFRGIDDTAYRHGFRRRTPLERRRAFEGTLRHVSSGAELLSFEHAPADLGAIDVPLSFSFTARLPEVLLRGKTRDEISLPELSDVLGVAPRLLTGSTSLEFRQYPLRLPFTASSTETLRVTGLDAADLRLHSLPKNYAKDYGGYHVTHAVTSTNGALLARRQFTLDQVHFEPSAYAGLREACKETEIALRDRPRVRASETKDADVRYHLMRTIVHLATPQSWTVTNHSVREALTYAGKKRLAEQTLSFVPSVGSAALVAASVSNHNGRVDYVTPTEINTFDAGWVASAPAYPVAKEIIVNLPHVETGSWVRVTTESSVTNAVLPWCAFYNFDNEEPLIRKEVELHLPRELASSLIVTNFGLRVASRVETNDTNVTYTWWAENPARIPNEPAQPPASQWRKCVFATLSSDLATSLANFTRAAERARAGDSSREARAKGAALTVSCATTESKVAALRLFLERTVRQVGPGIFTLPFNQAFTAPDRVLREGYGSRADRMNLLMVLAEGAGLSPSFVFAAPDARSDKNLTHQYARTLPRPSYFSKLAVRLETPSPWYWPWQETGPAYYYAGENEYTPMGATSLEDCTIYDPATDDCTVASPIETRFAGRTANTCRMVVYEDGAVNFFITNRTYGVAVGSLRKRFTELLPEMRHRFHLQLLGALSQNAKAISELKTETEVYPFVISFAAAVEEYAVPDATGDAFTVVIPDFDTPLFSLGGPERLSPICISGEDPGSETYEVVFPKGFTQVEHLPTPFILRDWLEQRVTTRVEDDHLIVTLVRTTRGHSAETFSADFFPYFKGWNTRATSRAERTITIRKDKQK